VYATLCRRDVKKRTLNAGIVPSIGSSDLQIGERACHAVGEDPDAAVAAEALNFHGAGVDERLTRQRADRSIREKIDCDGAAS
jgi:hypothetical protein